MASIYRGAPCPDCGGEGRIERCAECSGTGTIVCDLCGGDGVRIVPAAGESTRTACVCNKGYFTCGACSGGTGVCGRCSGAGVIEGK